MTTVLKLGGSVVTRKDEPMTVDDDALERAAAAIAGHDDLVVVHGGGSFGHHVADRHGVSPTAGTTDASQAREIHDAVARLNGHVIDALQAEDVPALPVHPLSAAARDADGGLTLPTAAVETMLDEGFVPVLHGDGVAHAGEGVTVLGGDEIVVSLAVGLDADRVGLCSATPGVLDDAGDVVAEIDAFGDVAEYVGASVDTDVTGGMAGKVQALLALSQPAHVFGLDGLAAFVDGGQPGTVVRGDPSR